MKIKFLSIFILFFPGLAFSQVNIDLSEFPKACYTQGPSMINPWSMGDLVQVVYCSIENGQPEIKSHAVVEVTLVDSVPTYILFPLGGTETDIFIYPIEKTEDGSILPDHDHLLLKKIIWMGNDRRDQVLQLNELKKGIYYVDYGSCGHSTSYLLHIK